MALSYYTILGSDLPGVRTFTPGLELLDRLIAPIDGQLRVAIDGEELTFGNGWVWDETTSTLTLGEDIEDLADDSRLVIWRETRQDRPWVQLTNVARMRSVDLMNYWTQIIYIVQDLTEIADLAAVLDIDITQSFENDYRRGRQMSMFVDGGEVLGFGSIELIEGIPGPLRNQLVVESYDGVNWNALTYDATPDDDTEYSVDEDAKTITIGGGGTADRTRIRRVTKSDALWAQMADGYTISSRQINTNQKQCKYLLQECPVPPRFAVSLLTNTIFPRGWNYLIYSGPGTRFSFDGSGWGGDGIVVVYVNDIPLIPLVDWTIDPVEFEIVLNIPAEDVTIAVNNWIVNWNLPDTAAPGEPIPPEEPGDTDSEDPIAPVAFPVTSDTVYSRTNNTEFPNSDVSVSGDDVNGNEARLKFDMSTHAGLLDMVQLGWTEEIQAYTGDLITVSLCDKEWVDLESITAPAYLVDGWVRVNLMPNEVRGNVQDDGFLYVKVTTEAAGIVAGWESANDETPEGYVAYLSLNGGAFPAVATEQELLYTVASGTPIIISKANGKECLIANGFGTDEAVSGPSTTHGSKLSSSVTERSHFQYADFSVTLGTLRSTLLGIEDQITACSIEFDIDDTAASDWSGKRMYLTVSAPPYTGGSTVLTILGNNSPLILSSWGTGVDYSIDTGTVVVTIDPASLVFLLTDPSAISSWPDAGVLKAMLGFTPITQPGDDNYIAVSNFRLRITYTA